MNEWHTLGLFIIRFSKGTISVAEKCGENNRPCEDCGYNDCKESEKCKWSSKSKSGNSKWTPGLCKPIGKKYQINVHMFTSTKQFGQFCQNPLYVELSKVAHDTIKNFRVKCILSAHNLSKEAPTYEQSLHNGPYKWKMGGFIFLEIPNKLLLFFIHSYKKVYFNWKRHICIKIG